MEEKELLDYIKEFSIKDIDFISDTNNSVNKYFNFENSNYEAVINKGKVISYQKDPTLLFIIKDITILIILSCYMSIILYSVLFYFYNSIIFKDNKLSKSLENININHKF